MDATGLIEGSLWAVFIGGILLAHARAWARREVLAITLCFDLIVGTFLITANLNQPLFETWGQEDAWVEWATFFAFSAAGVTGALALWKALPSPGHSRSEPWSWAPKVVLLGVTLFCFFVAGEEVSWGQRLLAFKPPDIFLDTNYQQELNVHNIFKGKEFLSFSLDSRNIVALVAVLYGILFPATTWLLGRWTTRLPTPLAESPPMPIPDPLVRCCCPGRTEVPCCLHRRGRRAGPRPLVLHRHELAATDSLAGRVTLATDRVDYLGVGTLPTPRRGSPSQHPAHALRAVLPDAGPGPTGVGATQSRP